jgi:hypothetical protein
VSNNKPGVAHRVFDEFVKFQTAIATDVGTFKVEVQKTMSAAIETIKEIGQKHNDLAAHVAAVEGTLKNTTAWTASELGKMGGSVQRHLNGLDQTTSAIDLNVLALAELAKELVGQLVQIDALINRLHTTVKNMFANSHRGLADDVPSGAVRPLTSEDVEAFKNALELSAADINEIKTNAEQWYGDLVASAFKTVRDRLDVEDAAKKEEAAAVQEAKEMAEKAATDTTELKAMQQEIQNADITEQAISDTISGGSGSPFPEGAELFGGS